MQLAGLWAHLIAISGRCSDVDRAFLSSVLDASWRRRALPQAIGCAGENGPGSAPKAALMEAGHPCPLMPYRRRPSLRRHLSRHHAHRARPASLFTTSASCRRRALVAVSAGPTLHVTGRAKHSKHPNHPERPECWIPLRCVRAVRLLLSVPTTPISYRLVCPPIVCACILPACPPTGPFPTCSRLPTPSVSLTDSP